MTRAWCIPAPVNSNLVTVLFTLDDEADIIPTQTDLERVAEYIEGHTNDITNQWEGKPSGAELVVKAPVFKEINPKITINPDKSELRTAVAEALSSFLYGINVGESVYLSQLVTAISNVDGVTYCSIAEIEGSITAGSSELITLGTITWQ